jgi:AcrR family transcriptional regulator
MPLSATNSKPKKGPGRPRDEALQERRRVEILDAAAGVFADDGYRNTDLQQIADALKVAKGTLYRYFKTKEELFLCAVDRGVEKMHEYLQASVRHVSDPLERIAGAIRAALAYLEAHPGLIELMIQERAEFRDRAKPDYFLMRREARKAPWEQLIRDLIAAGRVRDVPPRRVTEVMGTLVHGTMLTNHLCGRHKSHDEQATDVLDVLFNGILTDAERRHRGA